MSATTTKNLKLGRGLTGEGKFVEAKTYYEEVLKEMPDNLEAEWFYLFGSVTEYINEKTAENFARLAEIFYPTLKYIASFEEGEEKWNAAYAVIKGYLPLHDILHEAMVRHLASNSANIVMDDIAKVDDAWYKHRVEKKSLADKILEIFGDSKPYCNWAADIWKEIIAERFKWSEYRNFQDKGKELWFDELAKKIKKYDPSYEMPKFKQAGCVSSGDAGKVKPGE